MAKNVITELVDDISGGKAVENVNFALDNVDYEIDLSKKNADALRKALKPFVEAARKVPARQASKAKANGRRTPRRDLSAVRAWASENGFQVAERGRIPADVIEAYDQAN